MRGGATHPGARLSRFLLLLFLIGVLGTIPELVLLGHVDDWKQWIPLVLLGLGLPLAAWHWRRPGPWSVRGVRGLGVLYVVAGAAGVWLHLRGNLAFQRELDPTLAGWPLWKEVLTHGAPALAPGTMVWFGLLALLITLAGGPVQDGVPAASEE